MTNLIILWAVFIVILSSLGTFLLLKRKKRNLIMTKKEFLFIALGIIISWCHNFIIQTLKVSILNLHGISHRNVVKKGEIMKIIG